MLASVLYSARDTSSKSTSPLMNPLRSSWTRPRCCSSTVDMLIGARLDRSPTRQQGHGDSPAILRFRRLELFLPNAFLPIALADGQLERFVGVAGGEAAIVSIAAVAHDGIADAQ